MRQHATHIVSTLLCTSLFMSATPVSAQWTDHFSYSDCIYSAAVGSYAVVGNGTTLFYYDSNEGFLGRINKSNFLSATDITAIEADGNKLIVGYSGGDIDIVDLSERTKVNIPELRTNDNAPLHRINNITCHGNRYYCAFASGILEIDRNKEEIRSWWKIVGGSGINVLDVCVNNRRIYAATANGIYTADISSSTLEDSQQWTLLSEPAGYIKAVEGTSAGIVAAVRIKQTQNYDLYFIGSDGTRNVGTSKGMWELKTSNDALIATHSKGIDILNADGTTAYTISTLTDINGQQITYEPFACSRKTDGQLVIANSWHGMAISDSKGSNTREYHIEGPFNNEIGSIVIDGEVLYGCNIGRTSSFNNNNAKIYLSAFDGAKWISSSTDISIGKDATLLAANPADTGQVYLSTWGTGIFRVENKILSTNYSIGNSSLTDIFGKKGYVRTDAMGFDSQGNLFVVSPNTEYGFNIMTPEGEWYKYNYCPFGKWHSSAGLFITSNDNIWIYSTRMQEATVIVNLNGTPDDGTDDLYMVCGDILSKGSQCAGSFALSDAETGDNMGVRITAMAEDAMGQLWIGTPNGLLTCDVDKDIFITGEVSFNRIKVPRNDGTNLADYLLDAVKINAISVDGANRKWIGTETEGLYFVSEEGFNNIAHFTSANSPLPSNNILDVKIRAADGEVFILTDKGLMSYHSDATTPAKKMGSVAIYPNPVSRSRSQGFVNIDKTEADSNVFITDVSGNKVFYAKSKGGLTRWNLHRNGGELVPSGVYIVWVSNSDGTRKTIGKVLVTD